MGVWRKHGHIWSEKSEKGVRYLTRDDQQMQNIQFKQKICDKNMSKGTINVSLKKKSNR